MYTGTIFNWHDNSGFTVDTAVVDATNRPLFMVVNSFDKGPEKLMEVDATMFNSLFGTMSYDKHGQAAIQAQGIINAGGRLLVKRVCANDSGLANSVLVAKIENVEGKYTKLLSWAIESIGPDTENPDFAPKTYAEVRREAIKKFYKEDTEAGTKTYPLFIITDIGRGISNKAVRIIPDYDTSRGLEKMIYRYNTYEGTTLLENANISLDPSYTFNGEYYGLDKNRMVQTTGEVVPEMFDEFAYDVTKLIYPQYKADPEDPDDQDENDTDYEARIAQNISIVSGYDLINALDYKGNTLYKIDINGNIITEEGEVPDPTEEDPEHTKIVTEPVTAIEIKLDDDGNLAGADLNPSYGNKFAYIGDYGSYGETPAKFGNEHNVKEFMNIDIDSEDLPEEIADEGNDYEAYRKLVFDIAAVYMGKDTDGSDLDEIWDTDSHKIFAVCDANYHKLIKECISNFVLFRKDCIFLRDCNIGAYSVSEISEVYSKYILNTSRIKKFGGPEGYPKFIEATKVDPETVAITNLRSNFIADYGTTYEIIDPISKKNIEVTMLLDLAIRLTTMYIEQGPFAPLAGTYNGFRLGNAIEGTVNFVPIITPTTNQKQVIDDLRLNYAIFEDNGQCVVQSNYTSQDKNTQLSFINNVLAIQEVARVVRTVCPRNRFRLITGSDMSEYAAAVSRVLQGYNTYFETLEFTYTQDPLRSIQKIFYASINFSFNNWAQTEIFDLYALANTTTTSVNS